MSDGNPNPLLAIPSQVDVTDVTETEIDPRKKAQLETLGKQDTGEPAGWLATLAAGIMDVVTVPLSLAVLVFDFVMTIVSKFFHAAQGEKNSTFYDLAASVLGDQMGVEVDATALKQSTFGSGRLAGMETLGGNLYDLLAREFAPSSGNLEAGDAAPAKRFLGFLINWAIREGNVAVLSEFIPEELNVLKGFREYGELMAKNLGLGRLARRALTPLVQTLVADPLLYQLNQQYRPKRLDTQQVIKAYFRQTITQDQLRNELAQAGYTDDRQNFIVGDARPLLNERELVRLYFRGLLDIEPLTAELKARGWADTTISFLVESERPQMSASEVLDAFLYGGLPETDVLSELGKLGYDVTTASKILAGFKARHDPTARTAPVHIRFRSVNQLQREFLDGVIDLLEWNDALIRLGFGDDERSALTNELLVQQSHKKSTGATHAIPHLSWAQLKEAYKAGILSLSDVTDHLKARGYPQQDLDTLLKELPAPPPPPAPSTQ